MIVSISNACLNHPGTVRIRSITTIDSHATMHVTDWGLRTRNPSRSIPHDPPFTFGNLTARLPGFSHAAVTSTCNDHHRAQELDVNVVPTGTNVSTSGGFRITYGDTQTTVVNFVVTSCVRACPADAPH